MDIRFCATTSALLLFCATGFCEPVAAVRAEAEDPVIAIGHKHTLASVTLGENIDLVAHLPAGYATEGQRYPVLLLLGSEMRAKFGQAATTLDLMTDAGQLPAMLLVGIDLPHGNFVLVPNATNQGTASADRHLSALRDEIIPFVDRTFRTNGYRMLYGGSNSGLFAVYALLSGQLPVQAFFASSPMLGWCPKLIAERSAGAWSIGNRRKQFLFLLWSDDDLDRVTGDVPVFAAGLEKSAPAWLQWKSEVRHREGHVPEMDLALSLRALFPDYNPPRDLKTLSSLQSHYTALGERYGFTIEVPAALIFDVGMERVNAREFDEAQRIFAFGADRYPNHARMHAGLGFVCRQRGDHKAAAEHFTRAVAIDATDGWAKQQLAELAGSN